MAHGRSECDVFHHIVVIAERIVGEGAHVVGVASGVSNFVCGNNPRFIQSKSNTQAELVRINDTVQEERVLNIYNGIVGSGYRVGGNGSSELRSQVAVKAKLCDLIQGFRRRAKGRLLQETDGSRLRDGSIATDDVRR